MTIIQLAAINLILISLIVCQTVSYDVDSLFFIILSGHQMLLYVHNKTNTLTAHSFTFESVIPKMLGRGDMGIIHILTETVHATNVVKPTMILISVDTRSN